MKRCKSSSSPEHLNDVNCARHTLAGSLLLCTAGRAQLSSEATAMVQNLFLWIRHIRIECAVCI